MHIYSVLITAAPGKNRQAQDAIVRLRDAAVAANGLPTSAWAAVAGAPYGTFGLAARIEGTQQLLESMGALQASDDFNTASEESGGLTTGPGETSYGQVIASTTDTIVPKPLMSITRAVIAPGHNRPAIEAAVNMLTFVGEKAGLDGLLTMSVAGTMNELTWMIGLDSGTHGDEALATLGTDPAWADLEEASGPHFQGPGQRLLLARLP